MQNKNQDMQFNTLTCAKRLKEAGFTESQAEVQALILGEQVSLFSGLVENHIASNVNLLQAATKQDLAITEASLTKEIVGIRKETQELRKDIEEIRKETQELRKDIEEIRKETQEVRKETQQIRIDLAKDIELVRSNLTITMGYMTAGSVTILAALIKFL